MLDRHSDVGGVMKIMVYFDLGERGSVEFEGRRGPSFR